MNKNCVVNQRELHADTKSFTDALRAALREDPDVVLIGEMRDLETIESALRIAETGHLTFGTLHTNSATSTINRIIDVFPAHQQPQIRAQLSLVLEGIMCQTLLPTISGKGRSMIMEILIPNPAVRNLIREDKDSIKPIRPCNPGKTSSACRLSTRHWPQLISRSKLRSKWPCSVRAIRKNCRK